MLRPGDVAASGAGGARTHDLTIMREHSDNAIRIYQQQQSHPRHHQMLLTPPVVAISHHERHHAPVWSGWHRGNREPILHRPEAGGLQMLFGHPDRRREGEVAGSGGLPSLLDHVSQPRAGARVAFPAVGVAGVVTPAVAVRVVPASQSEEQALQVGIAGELVHERPELLVRPCARGAWLVRRNAVTRVFVSHAADDSGLAIQVHSWLVEDGHEAFLDRDLRDGIAVGEDWQARLHERLRWADAVVCVVTSAYRDSTWCAAELGIAQSRGSRVLPIRAEPGVVHPLLASTQYLELNGDAAAARARLARRPRAVGRRTGLCARAAGTGAGDDPVLGHVRGRGRGDVGDLTALHPRHRRLSQIAPAALAAVRVVDDRLVRVVDQRHRRPTRARAAFRACDLTRCARSDVPACGRAVSRRSSSPNPAAVPTRRPAPGGHRSAR